MERRLVWDVYAHALPLAIGYELSNASQAQNYAYNYCLCSIVICGDSIGAVML